MKIRGGKGSIPKSEGGGGPLFLAMKFTSLFLSLGKIQIFIPKSTKGGGTAGLGIIPKKQCFPNALM